MNTSRRTRSFWGAATVLVVTMIVTPAVADVIMFDNPPGQGHFDWIPTTNQTGADAIWLDITLPASGQPGAIFEITSFGQENFNDVASKILGGVVDQSDIQVGNHSALAWASGLGELIPADPPPPEHGWVPNPFVESSRVGTNFIEGQEAYVGIRFDLGNGWQYGWIGVVKQGLFLDTFAWGYETEVGVPIAAGVPEPGTLALLALGAGTMFTRRRSFRRG